MCFFRYMCAETHQAIIYLAKYESSIFKKQKGDKLKVGGSYDF